MKVAVLSRSANSLPTGVTAVLLERSSGIIALWVMAVAVALPWSDALATFQMEWLRWPFVMGSAAGLIAFCLIYAHAGGPIERFLQSRQDGRVVGFVARKARA